MNARGLGRGLSSLIGEMPTENLIQISIKDICADNSQPRTIFDPLELEDLQNSIAKNGVLQPILVRPMGNQSKYFIVAGERRWRAARNLGLAEIPAIVRKISDREAFEIGILENIQRENLSPLEEATSYKKLMDHYSYTQEKISEVVSKSRSHVANLLRLCALSDKAKGYLKDQLISVGHAKLLLGLDNGDEVADAIVQKNLNVRDTEKYIKNQQPNGSSGKKLKPLKNRVISADVVDIELSLTEALGIGVKIDPTANGARISIYCDDLDQLDMIVRKLSSSVG